MAQEIIWTLWRLPFIGIYFWLFARYLPKPIAGVRVLRHPLLLVAVALVLFDSFNQDERNLAYSATLALTSPIVGLREELFFRGIVQGFLERLVAPWMAIVIATVAFTAYHYGAQPMNPVWMTGIAAAGFILGVIYQRTRNLWLVAGLHALLDIVYALGLPIGPAPGLLIACHIIAMALALAWWRKAGTGVGLQSGKTGV